uniref:Uncharacterized protein n=1 Tax=Eptatretus burgeri TaxID=7764 RepID=A0A8C4QVC1_EPTBU
MDSRRARRGLGVVPAWLEIQGLSEDSLRATVTGLGIEILGGLCARAEPATVRVRFRYLSARRFTYTMYAELCRYMESCRAWRGSEWAVVPGHDMDAEGTGRPAAMLRMKEEDEDSVCDEDPEEDGWDGQTDTQHISPMMPPQRKSDFGRHQTPGAHRMRRCRCNETENERERRLTREREYQRKRRKYETQEQRAQRLTRDRDYHRLRRQGETQEERVGRLIRVRDYQRVRRERETQEERVRRLTRDRDYQRAVRMNERRQYYLNDVRFLMEDGFADHTHRLCMVSLSEYARICLHIYV